jgi:hypothetical protein
MTAFIRKHAQRVGFAIVALITGFNFIAVDRIEDDVRNLDFAVDLLQMRPAQQIGQTLQVEELKIVNAQKNEGIVLSARKGFGEMSIYNRDSGLAFYASSQPKGDGLVFLNNFKEEPILLLGSSDQSSGHINVRSQGDAMISMGFTDSDWPTVTLERQKRNLIYFGSDQNDNTLFTIRNHIGEKVVQIGASEEGYGYVGVQDRSGKYPGILLPQNVR